MRTTRPSAGRLRTSAPRKRHPTHIGSPRKPFGAPRDHAVSPPARVTTDYDACYTEAILSLVLMALKWTPEGGQAASPVALIAEEGRVTMQDDSVEYKSG